ncbi:MAG: 2-oxoacid:acceptor oxidoreductase family protein [Thermoplasmata archaeon]
MGSVIEIRFHGRGGQGAVIASELLAQAAFLDGKEPQSFPFFGVERRGAPVTAYARIDDRTIQLRTSIERPDVVVVLDPGLLRTTPVIVGLKEGGLLLVNTPQPPETLVAPPSVRRATVDATRIALDHGLGTPSTPIVNTAMLGALAKVTGVVSLDAIHAAVAQFVPSHRPENALASEDGYREVKETTPAVAAVPALSGHGPALLVLPEGPLASTPSSVNRTESWRVLTPVVHLDRCTRCNFCWKFCPDDAIEFDAQGFPVIRLEYCKGCGICAVECPPHTIEMVAVAVGDSP